MAADTAYALVQVVHNFGAVAVVGGPAAAWLWTREHVLAPRLFAWLVGCGWAFQALSGAAFGLTSWLSRGELPEVTGIARYALFTKVACAVIGFALASCILFSRGQRSFCRERWIWAILFALGAEAISAAAFLRWFG